MTAPKLRFKEFDGDWINKKIIDVADYVDYRGKTPKKTESGILLVTAKNIKYGYLDYETSQEFIDESDFENVMRRGKVAINDVLITTEAPLGNIASVDRLDIALAQRVIKYRGKENLLDNLFLKQKFLSESFQEILYSKATGGTVQGIKGSTLHQIPITIPKDVKEQIKIASFLSAVDEKISQLTQKHALLSQYKQGMMQKLFSQQIRFKADDGSEFGAWEEMTLLNIATNEKLSNGVFNDQRKVGRGYKLINVLDMYLNTTIDESRLNLLDLGEREFLSNQVKFGDIFFTRSSLVKEGIAHSNVYLGNAQDITFDGHLIKLSPKLELVDSKFLHYMLKIVSVRSQLIKGGKTATMTTIGQKEVGKVSIKLPYKAEQTKIANFLSAIDQKIEVVAQQIEQAKVWKKGLLQQMFV